jgi:hypothetical protein
MAAAGVPLREIFRLAASETAGWSPAFEAGKFPGHRSQRVSRLQPEQRFWKTVRLGFIRNSRPFRKFAAPGEVLTSASLGH